VGVGEFKLFWQSHTYQRSSSLVLQIPQGGVYIDNSARYLCAPKVFLSTHLSKVKFNLTKKSHACVAFLIANLNV